jgi:hypothetical protein
VAGWRAGRRLPTERPTAPLRGFKLAHPMLSADGETVGFSGVTIGRGTVYGVTADAECAQGGRHSCPSRWCDCGFYCLHTLDEAQALACDPDYRYAVLLEVSASGRFIRYEKGLRYAKQRVSTVRIGRCGCGRPARVFVETETGTYGWRRLAAVCPSCAANRPTSLPIARFAELLGSVPVVSDEPATGTTPTSGSAGGSGSVPPARAGGEVELDSVVDREALVPLLNAEVALLQARLDEVQRQLDRLTRE